MKNQDIKSGLFGSIGENMVAFELAKRNWYVYRPYFDTRIDFIAQKFVCKKCFWDWESKHLIECENPKCKNHTKELNQNDYIKTRKCSECGYIFDKYAESLNCPKCNLPMQIKKQKKSNQRNYIFKCDNCNIEFTSQTRGCVKCGSSKSIEYPICKICESEIRPKNEKCSNPNCNNNEYALIVRTIQVKSSHEDSKGNIAFNFKLQDLINDERHFLIVYSRLFEDFKEKHNFWVMSVEEFKKEYVNNNASTLIYQNARLHPPKNNSKYYFNEVEYNKKVFELQKAQKNSNRLEIDKIKKEIEEIDIFSKMNKKLQYDF
jgi:hypothetical protein